MSEFLLKYTGDRPRQPAYKIKLMLWRVSWALAQIFCFLLYWVSSLRIFVGIVPSKPEVSWCICHISHLRCDSEVVGFTSGGMMWGNNLEHLVTHTMLRRPQPSILIE